MPPFSWMGDVSKDMSDIKCPGCSEVLGLWDWMGRGNIKPAFVLFSDRMVLKGVPNEPERVVQRGV